MNEQKKQNLQGVQKSELLSRTEELCEAEELHADALSDNESRMFTQDRYAGLSEFFKAVGDETRIKILHLLSLNGGRLCVCDLAELLSASASAVSHQIRILKVAGLIRGEKRGKSVIYYLDDFHVSTVLENALEHVSEKGGKN